MYIGAKIMTSKNHNLPQRVKSGEGGMAVVRNPQCTKPAMPGAPQGRGGEEAGCSDAGLLPSPQ